MLRRTNEQKQTISIVHQNTAAWHYHQAMEAWDTYNHCLDDRGLYHPDFVSVVKQSLSEFHYHTRQGDKLMRLWH